MIGDETRDCSCPYQPASLTEIQYTCDKPECLAGTGVVMGKPQILAPCKLLQVISAFRVEKLGSCKLCLLLQLLQTLLLLLRHR